MMLSINKSCPVKAQNAGFFVSRGKGQHPTRIILSHELIFVKSGTLGMWEDDNVFQLIEGQTLCLAPKKRHGGIGDYQPNLKFYWIHFEIVPEFHSPDMLNSMFDIPQVKRVERPDRLEYLLRYFLEEQETGLMQQSTANWLVMLILLEVARSVNVKQQDSDHANLLAIRAHKYIKLNFDLPIAPCNIANTLGYNVDYLGRIYRQEYGYTLTEAIHRRRIKIAGQYLLDTQMTIGEIAIACGYRDANHFRRMFKRYMQHSPRDYRKKYSAIHVNTE